MFLLPSVSNIPLVILLAGILLAVVLGGECAVVQQGVAVLVIGG